MCWHKVLALIPIMDAESSLIALIKHARWAIKIERFACRVYLLRWFFYISGFHFGEERRSEKIVLCNIRASKRVTLEG